MRRVALPAARPRRAWALACLAASVACLGLPAPSPGQAADAGTVAGVVQLPPPPPKPRSFRGELYRSRLAPSRDNHEPAPTESPFADVVISAHALGTLASPPPAGPRAQMEQAGAAFVPHVLPVTVGTTVEFINRDRFYHNVFSLSPANGFDLGRKPTGEVVEHTFHVAGEVKVFCDIHPQMNAVILVLDTPWFTQPDSTGAFQLTGLPAGRYRLDAYHPEHEALRRNVEIGGGIPILQSFVFGR